MSKGQIHYSIVVEGKNELPVNVVSAGHLMFWLSSLHQEPLSFTLASGLMSVITISATDLSMIQVLSWEGAAVSQ